MKQLTFLKLISLCVTLLLGLALSSEKVSAYNCGDTMTSIDGFDGNPIVVKSNGGSQGGTGSCTGQGTYGPQYQCTELVDRYFGRNWTDTNGRDYFLDAPENDLLPLANGLSVVPPQHGDAIGFDNRTTQNPDAVGHVALIDRVWQNPDGTYIVEVVEQNWNNNGRAQLSMSKDAQGRYTIQDRGSYHTQGWLRYPKKFIDKRRAIPHISGRLIEDVFGPHQEPINWYIIPVASDFNTEINPNKTSRNVLVENYPGIPCYFDQNRTCDGVIAFDALGGAKSAYIVGWQQWYGWVGTDGIRRGGWELAGGPRSSWGNPITNSYYHSSRSVWRQDFQNGYAEYENFFPYSTTAPGMHAGGWSLETSYAFAEGYEKNGARNNVGEPFDNGGSVFVHNWSGVWIQDFRGGTYSGDGQSAISYNPVKNAAYHIRAGFWGWYKINNGPQILGAPLEDERCITLQPCQESRQEFDLAILHWTPTTDVWKEDKPPPAYTPQIIPINPDAPKTPGSLRIQ